MYFFRYVKPAGKRRVDRPPVHNRSCQRKVTAAIRERPGIHQISIKIGAGKAALRTLAAAGLASAGICGAQADEPIVLKDMGSFHVGGRLVEITGKPVKDVLFTPGGVPSKVDFNGAYQTGQMYVQYFKPQPERGAVPLLLWHGGGLTGVTYETTPDGREGWLNFFLRKGWSVYNSDAVERGRAGWSMYPDIFPGEPLFLTAANPFERFRIGAGPGSFSQDIAKRRQLPGSQFPASGYDNFVKQGVPRWTTTDGITIQAYTEEVDKVCPCAVIVHSQAGQFGFKVAQARPEKINALVAIEPSAPGDLEKVTQLRDVPILIVFGDYIEQDARWKKIHETILAFAERIKSAGGHVDVIDLPALGIKGNSHMMMMDQNNAAIAGLIQDWLQRQSLYR
jgi:hypothetical protein